MNGWREYDKFMLWLDLTVPDFDERVFWSGVYEGLFKAALERVRSERASAAFAWFTPMTAAERASLFIARIESVKVSPLNAQRWCLQLDCGHVEWITAQRRPTRQIIKCSKCTEKGRG